MNREPDCFYACCMKPKMPVTVTGKMCVSYADSHASFYGVLESSYQLFLGRMMGKDKYVYFAAQNSSRKFFGMTFRRKSINAVSFFPGE